MGKHLVSSAIALVCVTGVPGVVEAGIAGSRASAPEAAQGPRAPARMRFQSMDRNRDGQITRDEWRGSDRSFLVHDWNDDGRLSGAEVRIDARGPDQDPAQADHVPSQAERYMTWTERGFANLDHDRNRRITSDEGQPFLIGERMTVEVPASGRLYLSVNDDHLPDNRGQYEVTIAVQSARTPRR